MRLNLTLEEGSAMTFEQVAEWIVAEEIPPLVIHSLWVSPQAVLTPYRSTLNPWLALWRFEP